MTKMIGSRCHACCFSLCVVAFIDVAPASAFAFVAAGVCWLIVPLGVSLGRMVLGKGGGSMLYNRGVPPWGIPPGGSSPLDRLDPD